MAQIVKLRRSSVSGQKPTNTNLQLGELAQNTTDGKIFLAKSGSGGPSIEEIIVTNTSNTGSINLLGSVTASNFTGSFIGDGALLYNIPASGVTGLQLDRITSGNVSASISPSTGLVVNTGVTITGSISATEFTGSGLGLTNVPFHISGSDVDGGTYDKQFTKLQFDDSTGLNVSESVAGTAFISIGSHFRDIFVSGSDMLRATGSDAFEIIPEGGVEVTTSITDTNSNGYVKELRLSTTTLSSSLDTRISNLSGSVVYQSETSSMTVLSSSYALTASFALNAGAGAEGRTYIHTQSSASTTWTVTHNLGESYPAIVVFDSSDNVIVPGNISVVDDTTFTVTFTSAQSGKVSATVGGGLPHISASYTEYVLATDGDAPFWKGGLISGSAQIVLTGTTGYSTFSSSISSSIGALSSSIAATDLLDNQRLDAIETSTGSLNSFTSSASGRLTSIETSTGSLNTFTSSTGDRLTSIETSTGSLNTFTSSAGTRLTSLETSTSSLNTFTSSTGDRLVSIETSTSSLNTFSSSTLTRLTSIETSTGSLNSYTSSNTTNINAIHTSTASLNSFTSSADGRLVAIETSTSSLNTFSSSTLLRLTSLETASGSMRTDFNSFTSSYITVSSSLDTRLDVLEAYSSSQLVPSASMSFRTLETDVYCKNVTGTQINKGKVVRIVGATGDNPLIELSDNTTELNSANTLGITTQDIPNDSFGLVITEGVLIGVNTDGMNAGQLLYLGTSGSFTTTEPVAPNHGVRLGEVLRVQQNNGSIYVRIDNGMELSEAHDVTYSSITAGDLLVRNTNNVWINSKQLTGSYHITGSLQSTSLTGSIDYNNLTNVPTLVSGSSQIILTGTTGYSTFSSSVATTTLNVETRIGSLETESGSVRTAFNSYTSSANGRLNSIETSTGSLNTFSSSTNSRLGALETESGSVRSTLNSYTSSNDGTNTTQNNRLTSLEGKTGSYATTGSNSFNGSQTITGSLIVTQNLQVLGSSSIIYSTASQLVVEDNVIIVNASYPAERFAGIEVHDSGSNGSVTASLFWDGLNNRWIYRNTSDAHYGGGMFIAGPRNTGSLGDEPGLTSGRIPKSIGGDHIGDSIINEISGSIGISGSLSITGSIISTTTTLVSGSSQIDHNTTTNYVANEHINHTSVSISAGNGLSGGGDISATRTLTLDTGSAHFTGGVKSKMNTDGVISGSAQVVAALPSGTVSGSSQVLNGSGVWSGSAQLPSGVVSGSSQVSYTGLSNIPSGIVSGSSQVSYTGLSNIPSGIVSGSSQVNFTGLSGVPSGLVSGSSQVSFGGLSGVPSGLVSGSSQVLNGSGVWSGSAQLPSGVVSGSSQISFGSISGVPSGLVSGSSQISFGSISSIPSGLVSGSSQISIASTTGFGTYINQAVLTSSSPTFNGLTVNGASYFAGSIGNSPSGIGVHAGISAGGDGQIQIIGPSAHIDFANANSEDFDARLILTGNDTISFEGVGSSGLQVAGQTVWNAGNDGSGSGLDADLWDGYQFSSYLNQAVLTSSSPTFAGVTITGNSTLGDGNGDTTRINDILYLGASDSGDAHFYFGEDSSSWYGSYWYWDSAYTHYWYSRYAGTNTLLMYHDTRETTNVYFQRHILPTANNTYNLGSSSLGWANVYTNDLHLSNMNKPEGNDIDGTNGNWTIQEGAENLYIINNNNGKKYKISLEEI